MEEIPHYGFIVCHNTFKNAYYIGPELSTVKEKKIMGDTRYRPKHLGFDVNTKKYIYLVEYTVEYTVEYIQKAGRFGARPFLSKVLSYQSFPKKQFEPGFFSVNGFGQVSYKNPKTGETKILNPPSSANSTAFTASTANPSSSSSLGKDQYLKEGDRVPFDKLSASFGIPAPVGKGLEFTIRKADGIDLLIAELVVPRERFSAVSPLFDDSAVGIVPYYYSSREYAPIVTYYQNGRYGQIKQDDNMCWTRVDDADVSRVGRVQTSSNTYLVAYRRDGKTIPHPVFSDRESPLASSVCFLFYLKRSGVYRIVADKDALTFEFLLQSPQSSSSVTMGQIERLIKQGPREGQTTKSFLNEIITLCLSRQLKDAAEMGIKAIEQYKDQIVEDDYYIAKHRLLQQRSRQVLNDRDEEGKLTESAQRVLAETIEVIDRILDFANADFRLQLLLEKANKQFVLRQSASETLEDWFRQYDALIGENPEKEAGLATFYDRASQLRRAADYDGEATVGGAETEESVDELDDYGSLRYHDLVARKIDQISCAEVFGEEYKGFDDKNAIQQRLNDKDATFDFTGRLRPFLENPPESRKGKAARRWALARVYIRLEDVVFPSDGQEDDQKDDQKAKQVQWTLESLIEANIIAALTEEAKEQLSQALDAEKKGREREGDHARNTALFYCYLALSKEDEDPTSRIVAAIGTVCLDDAEFESALTGEISFMDMLILAQERKRTRDCARAMTLLAMNEATVRPFAERLLTEADWTSVEDVKNAFYESLKSLAGKEEGLRPTELLDEAANRCSKFVEEFANAPVKLVKGENAKNVDIYLNLFERLSQTPQYAWENDVVLKKLSENLAELRNYDAVKGFLNKSRIAKSFLKAVRETLETIRPNPSILSESYRTKLEGLEMETTNAYKKLLQTTKPLVRLGDAQSVEVEKIRELEYLVRIPVVTASNYAQDALDVRLIVNLEQEDFTSDNQNDLVANNLPSDGRTVVKEFTIRLLKPLKIVSFQARLKYTYIGDLKVAPEPSLPRPRRNSRSRRSIVDKTWEVQKEAVYPPEGWFHFELELEGGPSRENIFRKANSRLKLLGSAANMNYDNVAVKRLLKNRDKQIEEAFDELVEDLDDKGEKIQLSHVGRWITLYGPWRVGKTVILKCLEERLKTTFPYVIVINANVRATLGNERELSETSDDDRQTGSFWSFFKKTPKEKNNGVRRDYNTALFQGILTYLETIATSDPREKDAVLFYKELNTYFFKTLKTCFNIRRVADLKRASVDQFCSFFLKFSDDIRRRYPDSGVVLLVDEFTDLYSGILRKKVDEDFLKSWPVTITNANLLCVTAGGEFMDVMMDVYAPNTWQKADRNIYVKNLGKNDADEFVRFVFQETEEDRKTSNESIFTETSQEALGYIFKLTQGNVFLLRNVCRWLVDYFREKTTGRTYLTKYAVEAAIDHHIKAANSDQKEEDVQLFNPLYNPFNEGNDNQESSAGGLRIEDDRVKDDNLRILNEIVALAESDSHACSYDDLLKECKKEKGERKGMEEETFRKRLETLKNRDVVSLDSNNNVSIVIDLYYEVVSRLHRRS